MHVEAEVGRTPSDTSTSEPARVEGCRWVWLVCVGPS